jgi:hypothetical protein
MTGHFEPLDGPGLIDALRRDYQPNSAVAFGETLAALLTAQSPEALRVTIQRLEAADAMSEVVDMLLTAADALTTRRELVEAAIARLILVHDN